eukprot:gnl/MRDRNA2_/MRDRNA2_212407_c0_seq1.p1 gnl/MRDRNA2_/MRDRNA2_212407_c0~~gnl/MRDRNA2_/MRDRNA2_212407_c0_seq1.p1  ORF type:complete len:268 (-),score=55.13 gnl/MRDRNA2_/MRDRNA2_212407_c0_seq1:108-890(-)
MALEGMFGKVTQLVRDRGGRVLKTVRNSAEVSKAFLDFRSVATIQLSQVGLNDVENWVVWPGLFAGGVLDVMTAFLLSRLGRIRLAPGAAVLDFCCGSGAIARAVLMHQPHAEVHLADADALSIDAAQQNVSQAVGHYLGDGWNAVPSELKFDWIVSNPPVHRRRQDDFTVVQGLITGASARLKAGGRLWIVSQVQVPLGPLLEQQGFRIKMDSDGRFVLWRMRLNKSGQINSVSSQTNSCSSHPEAVAQPLKRRKLILE